MKLRVFARQCVCVCVYVCVCVCVCVWVVGGGVVVGGVFCVFELCFVEEESFRSSGAKLVRSNSERLRVFV